jgi:FkbM family methyltransferase
MSDEDLFLKSVGGVIHVGANSGQERDTYRNLGLRVLWIEAIAEVFQVLEKNITGYPGQRAVQALLADDDGRSYEFNIANNEGASSSIYDFGGHIEIWPSISFIGKRTLLSSRLDTLLRQQRLSIAQYPALVLDVQGAELLVLKGAGKLLHSFRFLKAEAANFEGYIGCAKLDDLDAYVSKFGFREVMRTAFAAHPSGGQYWNVVWERRATNRILTRTKAALASFLSR